MPPLPITIKHTKAVVVALLIFYFISIKDKNLRKKNCVELTSTYLKWAEEKKTPIINSLDREPGQNLTHYDLKFCCIL